MTIKYDELKKLAVKAKADLALEGKIDLSRPKVRKKPRDEEKSRLLYEMAINRLEKYKPSRDKDGKIILPYFRRFNP